MVQVNCTMAFEVCVIAPPSEVHDSPWEVQIPHTSKAMVQLLHVLYIGLICNIARTVHRHGGRGCYSFPTFVGKVYTIKQPVRHASCMS